MKLSELVLILNEYIHDGSDDYIDVQEFEGRAAVAFYLIGAESIALIVEENS